MPDEPNPNPNPNPEPPVKSTAATSMQAAFEKAFGPGGVVPEDLTTTRKAEKAAAAAAAPAEAPTGATGATAEAPTGATGATAEAPTGATGATAEAPTGATGATAEGISEADLDKAESKMAVAAGTAFKHVRQQNKDLAARLAEAEKKLAEASTPPPVDETKINELQAKLTEAEKKLAVVDFQGTPEYQDKVAKPLENAESALKTLAGKYNVDEHELAAALSEKDTAKRSDLLSDLSKDFNRLDMASFDRSVMDVDRLRAERSRVLGDAIKYMETQRQQADVARQNSMREANQKWQESLTSTLDNLTKNDPAFVKSSDETWNAELQSRIDKVKSIDIMQVPNEVLASALYRAEVLDMVQDLVVNLVTENQELDARVQKLQGTTPRIGDGTPPVETAAPQIKQDASFMDVLKKALPSTGLPG
jgi:hypothetical protein